MGGRGISGKENNVRFPLQRSQIMHMFRDDEGHLLDTAENRTMIINTARNEENYVGTKKDSKWYARDIDSERQCWVVVRDGIIQNCGLNIPPIIDWAEKGVIK